MISNRFQVWQTVSFLSLAAGLIGCSSGTATAPTTPVAAPSTVGVNGATPPRPGMGHAPPGMGHAPPGMGQAPGMGGAAAMAGAQPPGMTPPVMGANGTATPNPAAMAAMAGHAAPGSAQSAANMAANRPAMSPPNGAPAAGMDPKAMAAMMQRPPGPNPAGHAAPGTPGAGAPIGYTGGIPGANGGPPGANPATPPIGYTGAPGGAGALPGAGHTGPIAGMAAAGARGAATPPAGMMPGQPGAGMMPGQPGGMMPGQPGGGGGNLGSFPEGSVDDTLQRFCMALAEGDTAAASEYVSSRATGMVGQIRDGALSEERIEEISEALTPISDLQPNSRQKNSNTKRSLRNKKNQVLSFTLKKDKDDDTYRIVEFTVTKPKK